MFTPGKSTLSLGASKVLSRGSEAIRQSGAFVAVLLLLAAVLLLFFLGALMLPPKARAAIEGHLFDPEISLRGDCLTDEFDTVRDPWCPGPPSPSAKFEIPNIAIDSFGNMYVSNHETPGAEAVAPPGRIDVFSPEGEFITEVELRQAAALAVDSNGNLYVHQLPSLGKPGKVFLFRPSGTYNPSAGEIAYDDPGEVIIENAVSQPPCSSKRAFSYVGLAIDPETDHLFVSPGEGCVGEWSSAEEPDGPKLLDSTIGVGVLSDSSVFVAVDSVLNRLYVTERNLSLNKDVIQVFGLNAPHAHLGTIDGRTTPAGKFLTANGWLTVDADETSGSLIVSELYSTPRVFEMGPGLGAGEELLETYEYSGFRAGNNAPFEIAVDNSAVSPNLRTFYVPSASKGSIYHTFAFRFSEECEPVVDSVEVDGVTETEAVLRGIVNPCGGETQYSIEYSAQSSFEGATTLVEGTLPPGIAGVPVSAPLTGLSPGTEYHFRVSAQNNAGTDQVESSFRTYHSSAIGGPCPNGSERTGFSADLPDCRAYELVSPPDTNGLVPRGAGQFGVYFPTLQASPDGSKVSFRIEGGVIPGYEGTGAFNGDNYLSRRGAGGWETEYAGATDTEDIAPSPGAFSPDQEYSFWNGASLASGALRRHNIRYPDGHAEPVGRGSLGVDPEVEAELIAEGASHTLFSTVNNIAIRLEEDSPPAGTAAIYDRTADEVTHVVSLLPGDVTPGAGEHAQYVGASLDGEGVAFKISGSAKLYLRQDNAATYEVDEDLTFAGIAEGGGRLFYVQGGNLFAYDTSTEAAIQFSGGGDTTPVNVSGDGSTAYFVSPDVLTGVEKNPNGAAAQPGKENLYVSHEGQLDFVATVEPLDVKEPIGGSGQFLGLGLWVQSLKESQPALETSRVTSDGSTFLFESRAPLTTYDPDGHTEVYRYDFSAPTASLTCLSCNPTNAPATTDASLMTISRQPNTPFVLGLANRLLNLRPDGDRAFFQSYEPLVLSDIDDKQDIYEWEAQGVGSCSDPEGCVYLISSPQSDKDEDLFAVSESGNDVVFLTGNLLLGSDRETTPSLYDARVGGGFAEEQASPPCQADGCRPILTPPPLLPSPATPVQGKSGNVPRHCPKGKRKVRRGGKVRCVKKKKQHSQKRRHRHANQQKEGSR